MADTQPAVAAQERWPALPYEAWTDTLETLHMKLQVIGKVRLALAPFEPQWANVPLYVTARGLTTGPMPTGRGAFQIDVDFIDHHVSLVTAAGEARRMALDARPVADFHRELTAALPALGVEARISPIPSEVPDPIPFAEDTVHAAYDAAQAHRFWRVLSEVDLVFREYRAGFRGRTTPVHFFWGTFDLAVTRYSGRPADPPPGADVIMRFSTDAEQVSAGFWPGSPRFPEPAFFSYTYPKPDGIERAEVRPAAAFWSDEIGEFILRYEDVRGAADPARPILEFLDSTYAAGAGLRGWSPDLVVGPRERP